jgi:hypothetical protein
MARRSRAGLALRGLGLDRTWRQAVVSLRLAATASLEAMAGVIALTYQRRLQGGDQTLT